MHKDTNMQSECTHRHTHTLTREKCDNEISQTCNHFGGTKVLVFSPSTTLARMVFAFSLFNRLFSIRWNKMVKSWNVNWTLKTILHKWEQFTVKNHTFNRTVNNSMPNIIIYFITVSLFSCLISGRIPEIYTFIINMYKKCTCICTIHVQSNQYMEKSRSKPLWITQNAKNKLHTCQTHDVNYHLNLSAGFLLIIHCHSQINNMFY